jgi:hypothetical protein
MSDRSRRLAAGALSLTALALLAAGGWVKSSAEVPAEATESAALAARTRGQKALSEQLDRVGARAAESAQIPNLIAALETNVDAETFQDLFDTEEWWAGVRDSFPLSAIVVAAGGPSKTLARRGPEAAVRLAAGLVAEAQARKAAAGIVGDATRAYVVAATSVVRAAAAAARQPVLLLGQLADDKLLETLAQKSGGALGLSAGQKLLAVAGPESARQALADLVGREAAVAAAPGQAIVVAMASDGGGPLLASPLAMGPGLWLWVTGAPPPAPGFPVAAFVLFGLGALALAGAAVVLLKKDAAGAADDDFAQDLAGRATALASSVGPGAGQAAGKSGAQASGQLGSAAVSPANLLHLDQRGQSGSGVARSGPVRETLPMPRALDASASASIGASASVEGGAATPALAISAQSSTAPPKQMGRYRLINQIGEGGMAEVYIVTAQGPGGFERHFVVKRLHPQLAQRKEIVSQFIDEARLQARLLHSNIVSVVDFGTAGSEYFMALEYVHGRNFQQIVDRHIQVMGQPLPVSLVFYVAAQVLEALAYAHARTSPLGEPLGIVHRDVSPANVLVSFLGEVKLSDFGIVKAEERVSQTDHGVIKGNVSYMSPEQARSENVDQRSDLFSLAMLMFYALTGRTFYQSETMMGRLMLAALGPDAEQLKAVDELPAEAAAILKKALATDPADRYQSAEDFAKVLGGGLAGLRNELSDVLKEIYDEETRREY